MPDIEIASLAPPAGMEPVRALFEEYWKSFGFTPCFQGFAAELESLPGRYAPPGGRLALARWRGEPAGCGAFRPWDAGRCEAKRLYVRPEFRSRGVGRALLDWLVAEARQEGYREMLADTLPVMETALGMYRRYGFETIPAYMEDPAPGTICIRLKLA